jgi:hypothetical protein
MNEIKINELIQYRMQLRQKVKELLIEAEVKRLEINYINSQLELLRINQLEIQFEDEVLDKKNVS